MKPIVLVTGGSRGIGAATALLAARAGYAVAVNYQANSLAADEVVRQIRAQDGTAMAVQADVADEAQVLAMFARIDAKLGRAASLEPKLVDLVPDLIGDPVRLPNVGPAVLPARPVDLVVVIVDDQV